MAKTIKKKVAAPKAKALPSVPPMVARVVRTQSHFYKNKLPKLSEYEGKGLGVFFLLFEITAGPQALHIPISIASGRKSAGFLYLVEGGSEGVSTAVIQAKGGKGVTTVTSGSVVYTKIPSGMTASFIVNAEIIGLLRENYKIVVSTISYKTSPNDFRYKKFQTALSTSDLPFGS
jgi:hypothetical protein